MALALLIRKMEVSVTSLRGHFVYVYSMKFLFLVTLTFSSLAYGEKFVSDNFAIEMESQCVEGEVTCSNIKFTITLPGAERSSIIYGKSMYTKCADGVTPCRFQGYEFMSGGSRYFINSVGLLVVTDEEGNVLLKEIGKWPKQ